jgi:Domain of unknown function (DUF4263)
MTDDAQSVLTQVAFLGVADRSSVVRDGLLESVKWNIMGLKQLIIFNFFPANISGTHFVFAFRHLQRMELKLNIRSENGDDIGWITLGAIASPMPPPLPITATTQHFTGFQLPEGWSVFALPIGHTPIALPKPGRYSMTIPMPDGSFETIGEFLAGLVEPPPLTSERIAAIKSDPRAMKAIRMFLSCSKCQDERKAYAGLERNANLESEGFIWYTELPEQFRCRCGATLLDLTSLRRNMYAPLGNFAPIDPEPTDYVPLYEAASLDNVRVEFMHLLDSHQREEVFQKFIEENPILLRQFPADKIQFKPPILTFYNADFAVLSPQRELILIEIETPDTRLLKKDGDQAAPLTHAIDQIQRCLHVMDEHRVAALTSMKIEAQMVGNIRGVVIAGRDRGNDKDHLRRLKGMLSGRILFLTFDDLAASLAALVEQMRRL